MSEELEYVLSARPYHLAEARIELVNNPKAGEEKQPLLFSKCGRYAVFANKVKKEEPMVTETKMAFTGVKIE